MIELLQVANVLVIPAFGYIIILERRITRLQAQVEMLLEKLTGQQTEKAAHDKRGLGWL